MGNVQPGWYPDPLGRAPLRWWDGTAWADLISDDGIRSWSDPQWGSGAAPVAPGLPIAPVALGPASAVGWCHAGWAVAVSLLLCFPIGLVLVWTHPRWSRGARAAITGVVAVLLLGTMAAAGSAEEGERTDLATTATTVAIRTTTTERIKPTTTTTTSTTTTSTTTSTTTTTAPPTTTRPPTTTAPPTTAPPATVALAPPPPPQGSGCDPNYTGCVPIASDVDCEGGSGNGPEYTGRVEVIGVDVYDLDRDGDGIACEDS